MGAYGCSKVHTIAAGSFDGAGCLDLTAVGLRESCFHLISGDCLSDPTWQSCLLANTTQLAAQPLA